MASFFRPVLHSQLHPLLAPDPDVSLYHNPPGPDPQLLHPPLFSFCWQLLVTMIRPLDRLSSHLLSPIPLPLARAMVVRCLPFLLS